MVIRKGKHWLEICDENYYDPRICYQNEIDGFWVAFLYVNIQMPNANIESIVKKLVLDHCFKAAKLALPYYCGLCMKVTLKTILPLSGQAFILPKRSSVPLSFCHCYGMHP